MNGLRRGYILGEIILFVLISHLSSCKFDNRQCIPELDLYREKFDETIKEVSSCKEYGGYHIITTSGKHILIKPYQNIISWADSGERLVKLPNTNWAYLIDKQGDTTDFRLYSAFCDTLIEKMTNEK